MQTFITVWILNLFKNLTLAIYWAQGGSKIKVHSRKYLLISKAKMANVKMAK